MERKTKLSDMFRKQWNWLICISILLVLSIAAGAWGGLQPNIGGPIGQSKETSEITMLEGDYLACTLPRRRNDVLLVLDREGETVGYGHVGRNKTLQSLFSFQMNGSVGVCGILDDETDDRQYLSFAKLPEKSHRLELNKILALPQKDDFRDEFTWQSAVAETKEGKPFVTAAGVDASGKAIFLIWEPQTNSCEIVHTELDIEKEISKVQVGGGTSIQPDTISAVWVASIKEQNLVGKIKNTVSWKQGEMVQRDLLSKEMVIGQQKDEQNALLPAQETTSEEEDPFGIQYCSGYAFVRENANGNIHCITPDGIKSLLRFGNTSVGDSDYQYRDLAQYLVYDTRETDQPLETRFQVVGISGKSGRAVLIGEDPRWGAPEGIDLQRGLPFWWKDTFNWLAFWLVAIGVFVLLFAAVWCVDRILHSRRLATRLLLCELVVTMLLLTITTTVQYRADQNEEIKQLRLIGDNVTAMMWANPLENGQQAKQAAINIWAESAQALEGEEYTFQLILQKKGKMVIGFDSSLVMNDQSDALADLLAEDYLLESVHTKAYCDIIQEFLNVRDLGDQVIRQSDVGDDLYLQRLLLTGSNDTVKQIGCIAVSRPKGTPLDMLQQVGTYVVPLLVAFPLLILALLWITRKLLSPLDTVQTALEEFYTIGGGNQMELDDMPRTEIYEMGRVFNQLSIMTQVQMNALRDINDAYVRLVPDSMLHLLDAADVSDLETGKSVAGQCAILVLVLRKTDTITGSKPSPFDEAVEAVGAYGGVVADYDGCQGAITALFPKKKVALDCGRYCIKTEKAVMAAAFQDDVTFGVFGGKHLLYPLVLCEQASRNLAVLELLRSFGAKVIRCGESEPGLRLLGWDNGNAFYEELSWHSPDWKSVWHQADAAWCSAMELFHNGMFADAMRQFAKVLRLIPDDPAARWYLFRCDALRNAAEPDQSTDLLYEWEDPQ